jgi:hypothetical protein
VGRAPQPCGADARGARAANVARPVNDLDARGGVVRWGSRSVNGESWEPEELTIGLEDGRRLPFHELQLSVGKLIRTMLGPVREEARREAERDAFQMLDLIVGMARVAEPGEIIVRGPEAREISNEIVLEAFARMEAG